MSRYIRTYKARKAFLDALAMGTSISMAAAAAGGTTSIFRRWRESDPEFAKDWDDAIDEGTDVLEDAAFDRAVRHSDTLAMFMLKARRPEKFDRGSKLELSGGIDVTGAKSKLLNRIARLQAAGQLPSGGSEEESQIPTPEAAPEAQKLLPPPSGPTERGTKRRSVQSGNRRKAAA